MKKYMTGLAGFILLVCLDQLTKYMAYWGLKGTEGISVIPNVFELQYLENRGAAFGMLQNQRIFLLLITILILAFIILFFYRIPSQKRYIPLEIVLVFLAAGAVGNMIDRMIHGYVIDFLYFSLIDFPIFNVADCYVVLAAGAAVLLILFFYQERDFEWLQTSKNKSKGNTEK